MARTWRRRLRPFATGSYGFTSRYNIINPVEFDRAKSAANFRQRGISFERFADMNWNTAISVDDTRFDYEERRIVVFGSIDGELHVAVVTPRGEGTRVISLRRANRREQRTYAKKRQPA